MQLKLPEPVVLQHEWAVLDLKMKYIKQISILAVLLSTGFGMSCIYSRYANDRAVDELRQRLIEENFDEVYTHAASVTRAQLSRDEFRVKMKSVTDELKALDPEIKWVRDETIQYDRAVFRDDNFSSLDLSGNGRKVNIQLDWAPEYMLCGMSVIFDVSDGGDGNGVRVFRNCD